MTEEDRLLTEEWLSLAEVAALVDRCEESIRVDAKNGLIELTKRTGIRGRMARLDRFNKYVKRKHPTRCKPVTPETLATWRAVRKH